MKELFRKKLSVLQVLYLFFFLSLLAFCIFYFNPRNQTSVSHIASVRKRELKSRTDSVVLKSFSPSFNALEKALDSIVEAPEVHNGLFGFCLMAPDSGIVLLERNSHKTMLPASVVKTLTTGVALARLGPDYHFVTRLQYDGTLDTEHKVLNGNLYILGGGDPSLGSDVFGFTAVDTVLNSWTKEIKKLGIDSIRGAVIGDAEIFEHDLIPSGWAWEDMQCDYGIGPSGLAFHENAYNIEITPQNKATSFKVSPEVPGLILHNYVLVNPAIKKSYLYVSGGPYSNERMLYGEVKGPYEGFSQVPDPALFCAFSLLKKIKQAGIGVRDSCTTVYRRKLDGVFKKTERKTFCLTYSPPLSRLVYHTNQFSQNFYAETFLRMASLADGGYGSTNGGVGTVIRYFKDKGLDLHGFYMVDGSGVSRYDAVTPKFLCDMLCTYTHEKTFFRTFYESLPVSGESGTLRHLGTDSLTLGKVHAKGGYMTRVGSLAGYVTARNGMMYAFSIMFNNQEWDNDATRKKLERIMLLLSQLE